MKKPKTCYELLTTYKISLFLFIRIIYEYLVRVLFYRDKIEHCISSPNNESHRFILSNIKSFLFPVFLNIQTMSVGFSIGCMRDLFIYVKTFGVTLIIWVVRAQKQRTGAYNAL